MEERFCDIGDLTLCYEEIGDPAGEPMLLVMGLGTQMIGWPEGFCELLAERGFRVIRFDNRDIGRSSILRSLGTPRPVDALVGRPRSARYRIDDMAGDADALLRALEIPSAHVVGASMGGMIAQALAINHPLRVRSLTSIMSNTGRKFVGTPSPRLLPELMRKREGDREAIIEQMVLTFRRIGSRPPLFDEQIVRDIAARSIERGTSRSGPLRQLAAITTASDRTRGLRRLRVPALVIHGSIDPLVMRSGGRATARAMPGCRYLEVEGMGHDLPSTWWERFADAIGETAARAPAVAATSG